MTGGRPDRRRESYDLVAERYAAEICAELAGKPLDRGLLDALAEMAGTGTVIDIGCGPGHVAAYLRGRGAAVVGLDLSPGMCAAARRHSQVAAGAADMAALPVGPSQVAAVVCWYAVIHLDRTQRAAAYSELARVLRSGGPALIAFHVSSDEVAPGGAVTLSAFMGHEVELTFRFLDPTEEVEALAAAGLTLIARLDRQPYVGVEHPSRRSYLLVVKA